MPHRTPRRSLILAGGGLKVAFQAGVLQVWLDEAGLRFDHVDAASGGVFNGAMLCQGLGGREIADRWRALDPRAGIALNTAEFPKLLYAESLATLDGYRRHVLPSWGIDWQKIRASHQEASFNVFNFTRKELEVIEPAQLSEDLLLAAVSLPMWFPPVVIGGQRYIDAVYLSDANLEEAIRRGADELWVIWTVSDKDEWQPGFVATYFQIIESAAVGRYRAVLKRIAESNAALERGERGEFGRPLKVVELKADVALHYLLNFSQDRVAEAVNLGVARAREWCAEHGIALAPPPGQPPHAPPRPAPSSLRFTEAMKGFVSEGELDYDRGYRDGMAKGNALLAHLTIRIADVGRFATEPEHETQGVDGYVECEAFGGQRLLEAGRFNLFTDAADPARKRMSYRLWFRGREGAPLTLSGFKDIWDDPGRDVWRDTTTLYTRVFAGHLSESQELALGADPARLAQALLATGTLHIHFFDFLKQLGTFRVEGPGPRERAEALARFGRLFLGKLWDVYARHVQTSGPL